jgi:hypothetical protein
MLLQLKAKKMSQFNFFCFFAFCFQNFLSFFSVRDNPHVFTSGLLFCPFSTFPSGTGPRIRHRAPDPHAEMCGNLEHPKFFL